MKTILVPILLVVITLATPLTFAQTAIDGFSADRAAAERRWEEQLRAVPGSEEVAAVDDRADHTTTSLTPVDGVLDDAVSNRDLASSVTAPPR